MAENRNPTAVLIIIGNEILSGRTRDANLSFLGQRCEQLGIDMIEAHVVQDNESSIVEVVNECRKRVDYVFTTGGIGPTHDDITSATIARAFGVAIERNTDAVNIMDRYYPPGKLNEARLKMADIPVGATLIDNPVSGAPGFQMENVFVLPGVPSIMQAMFNGITDRLTGGLPVLTESVKTDITEGTLAAGLGEIQAEYEDVSIGSYPFFKAGLLGVNLILRSTDNDRLQQATETVREMIRGMGGKIFGPKE
ncbi:MAG: competence/damage-inducible protein A [Gammaproteobacteria bacterium]|nr:competence/damage-inducible protein A [Gammaproteobacteria bacterium]